jgi:hypothetical protein
VAKGTSIQLFTTLGYSNLMQHIHAKHQDHVEIVAARRKDPKCSIFQMNPKCVKIFNWLTWIVHCNLPFSFIEEEPTKLFSNIKSLDVETLKKYMFLVAQELDVTIKNSLPDKFGLVIDGWSEKSVKYFSLFAEFPDPKTLNKESVMLSISPLFDETNSTAANQASWVHDKLEEYGKAIGNVLYLVGDNENTNPALANILGVPFVGCDSHRLNLALEGWQECNEYVIGRIAEIMLKLGNSKNGGILRISTDLEPVIRNKTRWSSEHEMIKRFFRLKEFITPDNLPDVFVDIPNNQELNRLKELAQHMSIFEGVVKFLQGTSSLSYISVRGDSNETRYKNAI